MTRLDRRGRRIGRNWWRELIVSSWSSADHAWWLRREAVAIGYETEEAEFATEHPRPTLKAFMVSLAGTTGELLFAGFVLGFWAFFLLAAWWLG